MQELNTLRRSALRRAASKSLTIAIALSLFALVWSCAQPLSGKIESTTGTLRIKTGGIGTQTVVPDTDMQPAEYSLVGTGPDGETFTLDTQDGSGEIDGLTEGEWSVEAVGENDGGFLVVQGEASTQLEADEVTSIEIPVTPVDGVGTVSISAEWDPELLVSSDIAATMTDAFGHETTVDLSMTAPGAAQAEVSGVPAGYHRLFVQLLDGGSVVTGAGESVRVVAEATTSVVLPFADLNKVGTPIHIAADQFVLAWDPPQDESTVDNYRVYARLRGEYGWTLIGEVGASSSPTFTVDSSILSYGTYEIAVSTVAGSAESEKHTSMDDNAEPNTGWYVEWVGP